MSSAGRFPSTSLTVYYLCQRYQTHFTLWAHFRSHMSQTSETAIMVNVRMFNVIPVIAKYVKVLIQQYVSLS